MTFWALSEIVKSEAGILESEPPERAAAKLAESVAKLTEGGEGVDAEWIRRRLAPLAGTGASEGVDRGELFSAWLQYFELMAARTPLILVIEDLHWADEALADFLEHMMDWAQDAPILVLCTARPEWFERRPGWGGGKREAVTVGLAALTADETAHLVAALLERAVMPADAQQALMEHSGGNPLYVTEYVRLAAEEGWFDGDVDLAEMPLPDSVHSIIASRLDLLDAADKGLIQAAAVVGRVFWSGALTFLRGLDEATNRQSLLRLVRRELIQPVRRTSMQGQEEFTFSHVVARDVAYGQLTRGEKARLHRETARWLEAVSAGRIVDVAELLAYHHTTALELEPSTDPELLARVYRFLMLAGERNESLDLGRAAGFYERAVDLAATTEDRAAALLARGKLAIGHRDEGISALSEAITAFEEIGDRLGSADALSRRSGINWWAGNKSAADSDLAAALALIESEPDSDVVARVLVVQGFRLQLSGEEEEALDVFERALAVAQSVGDTEEYANALRGRGSALTQMGDRSGHADVEESLRIHLDRGDTSLVMSAYNNLATYEGVTGEVAKAVERIDEAIAYAAQRGAELSLAWSRMTKCESLVQMGDFAQVEQIAAEVLAFDEARGSSQVSLFAKQFSSWVRWVRGDAAGAWSIQREVADASYEIHDPQVTIPNLALAIALARSAGVLEEADRYVNDFAERALDNPGFLVGHLNRAAPAMIDSGMRDSLEAIAIRAHTSVDWPKASSAAVMALIAEHDANPDEALELLLGAIEVADRQQLLFEATNLRVDAARCAIACGRTELAPDLIATARSAAGEMGAAMFFSDLDELEGSLRDEASGA